MSAAQSSSSAAAAASPSRAPFKQRPRHFWEGPDPADESDEQKQGAEHVSPVARLYRHALESVFGFLELADLSRVLSVSRSWSSSVCSMKSIGASLSSDHVLPWMIAASSLAVHISKIGWPKIIVTTDDLFILSRHLGSLTSLKCGLDMAEPPRLFFGASIKSLELQLQGKAKHAPAINDAIVAISRLSSWRASPFVCAHSSLL